MLGPCRTCMRPEDEPKFSVAHWPDGAPAVGTGVDVATGVAGGRQLPRQTPDTASSHSPLRRLPECFDHSPVSPNTSTRAPCERMSKLGVDVLGPCRTCMRPEVEPSVSVAHWPDGAPAVGAGVGVATRRGRCRRRRIKHQVLRLHIAHHAVCPNVRPFPRFAQYFHARAVRKNVQAGGGVLGPCRTCMRPEVELSVSVAHWPGETPAVGVGTGTLSSSCK